ncbi:MAG: hypothetical protein ACK4Z7_01380 [Novosphingobium sp.]
MKINRTAHTARAFSSLLLLLAGACAAPDAAPPPAAPAPAPKSATPSPPVVSAPAFKDWRDAPQTSGDWVYAGGTARFVSAEGTLFAMTCNRAAGSMTLSRAGSANASLPMTIVTTSEVRTVAVVQGAGGIKGTGGVQATLAVNDPLLDAMAFSRGRFAVETSGLPTVYLPAWAEVGRVIEDCR